MDAFCGFISRIRHKVLLGRVGICSSATAIRDIKPQYLLLFLISYNLIGDVQHYLCELNNGIEEERIFVAGNYKLLNQINYPEKVHWLRDIDDLEKLITNPS